MFKIVKKAIDEFNPFELLPEAPSDEFDNESREIARKIKVNSTVEEIARIISEVLSNSFDSTFKLDDCMVTAEKIYSSIEV